MIHKIINTKILLECLFIVLCAVVFGLLFNWHRDSGLAVSFHRPASTAAPDSVFLRVHGAQQLPPLSEPEIINKLQLVHLLQQQSVILLDARIRDEYLAGHIPGALNVPAEQMYEYQDILNSLSREKWIVCYCDGPPCELGELLASQLFTIGYPLVAYYMDGLDDWKKTEEIVIN